MLDMVTIADRVPSLVVIAWGRVFRIPTDDLVGQLPCHCRKRWALNVWWCCAASDAEGEGYLYMSDRRYVHEGGVVSGQGKGEKGEGRLSSCHALSVRGYFRGSTPSNSAADTAPLHLVPSFPPPIARTLDYLTPGPSLPPSPIALKLHTHTHTHTSCVRDHFIHSTRTSVPACWSCTHKSFSEIAIHTGSGSATGGPPARETAD